MSSRNKSPSTKVRRSSGSGGGGAGGSGSGSGGGSGGGGGGGGGGRRRLSSSGEVRAGSAPGGGAGGGRRSSDAQGSSSLAAAAMSGSGDADVMAELPPRSASPGGNKRFSGIKARLGIGGGGASVAAASTNEIANAQAEPEVPAGADYDGALDVEELVRRAAASAGTGETAEELEKAMTKFSPWQYEDENALEPVRTEGVDVENVEGTGDVEADRKGLLKRLRQAVGVDLTRIAIPVYYNEPTSFLHRMAEACQYYQYLNQAGDAAAVDDAARRLMLVTVFAIVPYSSAERTLKPFNPILGETFEWTTKDARFICEQVSHHPPICAGHMETASWTFEQYKEVKANFTGNSVVAPPAGNTYVTLKRTNARYCWPGLTSCVHNILFGRLWVDHYGTFKVENVSGGKEYAEVTFTQCGWFSRGWHQVKATVYDADGKAAYMLDGHWNDKLTVRRADAPAESAKVIWEKDRRPAKDRHTSFKGFSMHGQELNELTALRQQTLPPTDSRFRPDCLALAQLNYKAAGQLKYKLEEKQRAERKIREKKADEWRTRYFEQVPGSSEWRYMGTYWQERERLLKEKGVEDPVTPSTGEW